MGAHAAQVRIVKHRQTKALYALKYVDKDKCIRKNAAANTLSERDILEELKHDFIVNLRYAFQDDEVRAAARSTHPLMRNRYASSCST